MSGSSEGGDRTEVLARAQAVRRAIDYMLSELEAIGIADAAHLMDACGAALDEWLARERGRQA